MQTPNSDKMINVMIVVAQQKKKYHHGEVVINITKRPIPNPPFRSTRQSVSRTQLPACRTIYRKQSFPRTISEWNCLSPEVVSSASVGTFKSRS